MGAQRCRRCKQPVSSKERCCPNCNAAWPDTRAQHWIAALLTLLAAPILAAFLLDVLEDQPRGETLRRLVDKVQTEIHKTREQLGEQ